MNGVLISTSEGDTELNRSRASPHIIRISIAVNLLGNYIRSDSKVSSLDS